MKIVLDLDGVFANFVKALNRQVLKMYPGSLPGEDFEPKRYYYEGQIELGKIKAAIAELRKQTNFWMHLEPFEDAKRALLSVDWYNHDLYFMTSRFSTEGLPLTLQTRCWIRDTLGLQTSAFSIIAVKDYAWAKRQVAAAISAEFSLDDRSQNVFRLSGIEGHYAYLLDRPYNREKRYMLDDVRVKSVDEFFERIGLK